MKRFTIHRIGRPRRHRVRESPGAGKHREHCPGGSQQCPGGGAGRLRRKRRPRPVARRAPEHPRLPLPAPGRRRQGPVNGQGL